MRILLRNRFYEIGQDTLDSIDGILNSDITLLMGNLNAKIGKVTKKSNNINIVIYGIGRTNERTNERGNKLEEF